MAIDLAKTLRTNYCFTCNNYTDAMENALKTWLLERTKYAVFGHELAPSTGTPHLQGFFSLKKQARIGTLQNSLSPLGIKLAIIPAKGNAAQNRAYCTKSDTDGFYEIGTCPGNAGTRNDLAPATAFLRDHTFVETADKFPELIVKYPRGFQTLKSAYDGLAVPEDREISVSVFYGDAGTGKTRRAVETARKLNMGIYIVNTPNNGSLWWDNYTGQQCILIDDFYGWIKPHDLFRYLDRYPLQIPIKGGFVWARWIYVFLTSNAAPEDWYSDEVRAKFDQRALFRRLHNICRMSWPEDETGFNQTAVAQHWNKREKKIRYPDTNLHQHSQRGESNSQNLVGAIAPSSYATDTGSKENPLDVDDEYNEWIGSISPDAIALVKTEGVPFLVVPSTPIIDLRTPDTPEEVLDDDICIPRKRVIRDIMDYSGSPSEDIELVRKEKKRPRKISKKDSPDLNSPE